MGYSKIVVDIKECIENLSLNKKYPETTKEDLKLYQNNLINLSMYALSKMPYFDNRYDFMRLKLMENGEIFINSQESNVLPLLTNKNGNDITADFLENDYFNTDKITVLKRQVDINILKEYKKIIERSDNFFDFVDNIKKAENENEDFIINLRRQEKKSFDKNKLLDFVVYFLDKKPELEIKKKFISYERDSPNDMFLLRDAFSMEVSNYIRKSPKEILKTINESLSPIKELSRLLDDKIELNSTDAKKTIKNINKMIKQRHPVLEKTPFGIMMSVSEKNKADRTKTLIDKKLFKNLKNKDLMKIEKELSTIKPENDFIEEYQKEIDYIIDKIIKKYPEFTQNIKDSKNFSALEVNITKNNDKTPLENFHQNWQFFNSWNQNESFKGIGFMDEEFINQTYNKEKRIIAIKNNLENVGYITIYKENNGKIKIHSITPTTEIVNNPDFVKYINKTINDYVKKENGKILSIDNNMFTNEIEELISNETLDLYFKDIDCYIVGVKWTNFKRDREENKNLFHEQIEEVFERMLSSSDINISDKIINRLKKLEKKYENNARKELPFEEEIKLIKEIRQDIIDNIEKPQDKRLKYVN